MHFIGRMQARGFTLLEVMVAIGVLSVGALSAAQLIVMTTRTMSLARSQTISAASASSRMARLRAVPWSSLAPSPFGAIDQNTPGFVDFLNAQGGVVSTATAPPPDAAFVRRWSIETPAAGAADLFVLQVLVRPITEDAPPRPGIRGRSETYLVTLRTRTLE